MNISEAIEYINAAGIRGSILGLSRMKKLCDILGNPEDELKFIHVAGTNGKGSTACFISTILTSAGYKTGMYYSPALSGNKDHYMIDGCLISDEDYSLCVESLVEANNKLKAQINEEATQFELETALAFLYFKMKKCDFVVLETGLGGEEDATNVVKNKVACVFTSISYDHMAILGNTLSEIASVKAGIIVNNCPVIAFNSSSEVIETIQNRCNATGSRLTVVDACPKEYFINKGIELSLRGTYQRDNALIAVNTIKELCKLNIDIDEEAIVKGLEIARWPYRYEKISDDPIIYLDGAHNPDAANRLYESLMEDYYDKDIIFVIGMFKDKDCEKVIGKLAPIAKEIYTLTTLDLNRALSNDEIKTIADKYCDKVYSCKDIREAALLSTKALTNYKNGVVVAFGSLSYLDAIKKEFNKEKK